MEQSEESRFIDMNITSFLSKVDDERWTFERRGEAGYGIIVTYILSFEGEEVGRLNLPYCLEHQMHLHVISTVLRRQRMSPPSPELQVGDDYERIPDDVRALDQKFKTLVSQLYASLRAAMALRSDEPDND